MDQETTTPEPSVEPGADQSDAQAGSAAKAKSESEIVDELGRLGNAFVQALQAAWASDERKKLEQDLNTGLRSLVDNVEEALEKVGKNEQVHEVLDKAEDMAESVGEKVREAKATGEIKDGLLKGLAALTQQLQKLTQEVSTRQASADPPATPDAGTTSASAAAPGAVADDAQDIPIQKG